MTIEEILNSLDEMLDSSWSLPLSGGRCVVDADRVRDMIDDIRINLPAEIKTAQEIVAEHANILDKARKESEAIIRKAEMRARTLTAEEEVLKQAKHQAAEIQSLTQVQSREMRQAAYTFSDETLKQTEEAMCEALNELRATRKALRTNLSKSNQPQPPQRPAAKQDSPPQGEEGQAQ